VAGAGNLLRVILARPFPVIAVLLTAVAGGCGGNGGDGSAGTSPQATSPGQAPSTEAERGKELFASNCGACHTLDAAGTDGVVGPNLDTLDLDERTVLEQIRDGGGGMPAGLVSGADARAVARFVAGNGA
jgi:mono/diheme cytochrome c family protein